MKKEILSIFFIFVFPLLAHFQMILPNTDIVEKKEESLLSLTLFFCHPFEQEILNMEKPQTFGVLIGGEEKVDLTNTLKEEKREGKSVWKTNYQIKKPGDHLFYVEPKPYFEPAEKRYIVHYTKVIVNGFGLENAWDKEVGMKVEIIPLTRPYGLYVGNVFRGRVLVNGKPAPFVNVEVEYYNEGKRYQAPSSSFITQVIKTDENGIFCYGIPKVGWWGFAALIESEEKIKNPKDKKEYPVEIGGVIWVKAEEMK